MANIDMSLYTEEQLQLNKDLLYDINMGYVDVKKITPGHGVLHYEAELEYNHPWSYEAIMEQYHFHKLNEFMTLTEYLTLPAFTIKKLLKGSSKGKADRAKYEEEKRKEAKRLKEGQLHDTSNRAMPPADPELAAALKAAQRDIDGMS